MMLWPPSRMRIVKGHDKFQLYKLRPSSTGNRCYTTCCNTVVIASCGANNPMLNMAIPMNRSTVTPPIEPIARVMCSEAVQRDKLPNNLQNCGSIPFGRIPTLMCGMIGGTGGACRDEATRAILTKIPDGTEEVMGAEAYAKCGFDTKNIK